MFEGPPAIPLWQAIDNFFICFTLTPNFRPSSVGAGAPPERAPRNRPNASNGLQSGGSGGRIGPKQRQAGMDLAYEWMFE
jgi:hypothetical protein